MSQGLKELVLFWNEKAAEVLNFHTNPGDDARRMAIIHIAMHNVICINKGRYTPYGHLKILLEKGPLWWKEENKEEENRIKDRLFEKPAIFLGPMGNPVEEALNSAAYEALKWAIDDVHGYTVRFNADTGASAVFLNNDERLKDLEEWKEVWYEANSFSKNYAAIFQGKKIADQIIEDRSLDGSGNVVIRSEQPADGQPSEKGVFRANYYGFGPVYTTKNKLLVNYGDVKTFVLSAEVYFSRPQDFGSAQWNVDYREVKEVGIASYQISDPVFKAKIAYWDLLQHITWNTFARSVIKSSPMDGCDAARVLALVHTAMADAAIAMFKDLYSFNRWRPVTAINDELGKNPMDRNDKDVWRARYDTPRVPEYPSAFSLLGGAVGRIFQRLFPSGLPATIILNPLVTYTTVWEAVDDNAYTKIYRGWNFRTTVREGLIQGRKIGQYVLDHSFQPKI